MKKLAIIGSGDLGQLIAYHAENDKHYEVVGYFDDYKQKYSMVGSRRILGPLSEIDNLFKEQAFDELMIGIGYKHAEFRKKLFEEYSKRIPFGRIIHTSAYIDKSSKVSDGCFILPRCVIDMNVILEQNVLLNTACIIAHDSVVEAHSFLSPGVVMAGFVRIGQSCNIGINTTIIDNIVITAGTQTGGGSVVIKNIEKRGLYVGNPARFVR